MKPISRHHWKGTICLFLLVAVLQSCKKEATEKNPNTGPSAKREITGSEAEGILKDIEQFYKYANEVKSRPGTAPVTLPKSVTLERANAMIENVFNFYFARLDYRLAHDTPIVVSSEGIELTGDGVISTLKVAEAFNKIRAEIKTFYDKQLDINATSKFILADAEFKITGGKALISVKGIVGQDLGPEPDVHGAYPPFDNSDKWSIYNLGGRDDGYANGQWGSPEILTMAVSQDIYPGAITFKVNIVNFAPAQGWTPPQTPSGAGAPDNPMHLIDATMWDNSLIHLVKSANPSNPPISPPYYFHVDADWLVPSAMDYYRTWIKNQVLDYCTQNNKSLVKIKVHQSTMFGGSILTYYTRYHVLSDFLAGDEMSHVPVPSNPAPL